MITRQAQSLALEFTNRNTFPIRLTSLIIIRIFLFIRIIRL